MKTVLHIASVFPSSSNRLALQFGYAKTQYRIELLHLAATASDLSPAATQGFDTRVLPHWPALKTGDSVLLRRARSLIRRAINFVTLLGKLTASKAELLHAHENSSIFALAFWVLFLRRPAIWDPHDFFHDKPGGEANALKSTFYKLLEEALVKRRTAIVAVSKGMADKYRRIYPQANIVMVYNYSSKRTDGRDRNETIAETAGNLVARRDEKNEGRIRLVYPGLIKPRRFASELFVRIGSLPGVSLDIYGEERSRLAEHHAALAEILRRNQFSNIRFRGRYTPDEIIPKLADYHFAIFPYLIDHPNIDFCLPNKFFQCIEAGLPMIISNMKEMSAIFAAHGLGYTFPDRDYDTLDTIISNCDTSGESYRKLVRNVLTYRDTQIDYRAQRALLLRAYSGERDEIPE